MKPTREGVRFLLATGLIGLAALNTGNNLIYLVLSLMAALVLLSLVVLRMTLSGLSARVIVGHPVFAGEPVPARVIVENLRGRVPAYSVHVTVADRHISALPAYRVMIPRGGSEEAEPVLTFRKRGRYDALTCEFSSSFPFQLFTRSREVACAAGITVYPRVRDVAPRETLTGHGGALSRSRAMERGDELHSLRDYRSGDDVRAIHWKASAKSSTLIVREFARDDATRITLVMDNLRHHADAAGAENEEEVFEKAVSLAASLARYFLNAGYLVSLISCRSTIPFGLGQEHFLAILDLLAVIGPEDAWDQPLPAVEEGAVFVARRRGSVSPAVAAGGGAVVYASDL